MSDDPYVEMRMSDDAYVAFLKEMIPEFPQEYKTLIAKYNRRQRSPLKFVEYYKEFGGELSNMEFAAKIWPHIKPGVDRARASFNMMRPEFERCIPLAREQLRRKQISDELFGPVGPVVWQGGRADGNS
jgi:hypothetical protein